MPRLAHQTPSYRLHKPSGQALVTLNGRDCYLGEFDSPASRQEYDRLIAEWLANGRRLSNEKIDYTIAELVNAYRKHAESWYRKPDGTDSGEFKPVKMALRPLNRLYGHTRAIEFGPLAMKTVRDEMVRLGWCRTYINAQVGRIKRMFRWGVENEHVPAGVHHALQAITGLKAGRTEARESDPVRPVPDALIDAVLPLVPPPVRVMIELQVITGMRPGEVVMMRGCDIDTGGDVWTYRPATHKTQHHGHERHVALGPKAQQLLKTYIKPDPQAFLFTPAEAEAQRRRLLHAGRRTPMSCGNTPGSNRKRQPKRRPGDRYDVAAYRRAIARACDKAFPPPATLSDEQRTLWHRARRWNPHRLRHNAATRLRKAFGIEAAQLVLGHRSLSATEIYAEKNFAAARQIASLAG